MDSPCLGCVQRISTVVVPLLPHSFVLESGFCKNCEILIGFRNCTYEVQSDITERFMKVLKKRQAEEDINTFQSVNSKDRFGRTNKITMNIDTGDARPFNQHA